MSKMLMDLPHCEVKTEMGQGPRLVVPLQCLYCHTTECMNIKSFTSSLVCCKSVSRNLLQIMPLLARTLFLNDIKNHSLDYLLAPWLSLWNVNLNMCPFNMVELYCFVGRTLPESPWRTENKQDRTAAFPTVS